MFISPSHMEAGIAIISLGISIFALKMVLAVKEENAKFTTEQKQDIKILEVKLDQIQAVLSNITSVQVKNPQANL